MRCPSCFHVESEVKDSRSTADRHVIRRSRRCKKCKYRFTTYEMAAGEGMFDRIKEVVKALQGIQTHFNLALNNLLELPVSVNREHRSILENLKIDKIKRRINKKSKDKSDAI